MKLSVAITTLNNADTLDACLASVAWADEIVVLDSYSDDATLAIARAHRCRVAQHEFLGYGKQKQVAVEMTTHDWVLLLDADEVLSTALQDEIRALLVEGPRAVGYEIPRCEQLFWRMCSPAVRWNRYLRLFDKRHGRLSEMPVHAAPEVDGATARLRQPFYHFGETDIHTKVAKINGYSSGLVADKLAKGQRLHPLLQLVFYPPFAFLRSYIIKRGLMNGWAGFISAVVAAFYAFLKYAKLYEQVHAGRYGASLLPPEASRITRQSIASPSEDDPPESSPKSSRSRP